MIDVIYLTGGIGKRTKLGYPKQFARLKGKPIMVFGLETLRKIKEINKIIIPYNDSRLLEIITKYNIDNWHLCNAGKTRQESVYNGLRSVKTEQVLICESVRPFMSESLIKRVINDMSDYVSPIDESIATIINLTGVSYNRKLLGQVQMPQKFDTKKLLMIHEKMNQDLNSSDDMDLIYKYYKAYNDIPFNRISVILGERENIKITYPIDLKIAEAILNYKEGSKIE